MAQSKDCHDVFCWGWVGLSNTGTSPSPVLSKPLSELDVKQISCGERSFLLLTHDGKVYSNLYNAETQTPFLLESLAEKVHIVKVASHPDARHYLALSKDGAVYSWGSGDVGALGVGDTNSREEPTLVSGLSGKDIITISCGSSHSAAISSSGELYTWGQGNYGRLGHGTSDDMLVPTLVSALKGHHVVDVACGSGDAQTLAVTKDGKLWSWGDGDYGKLGRGGSDSCKLPKLVEKFKDEHVVKALCGAQVSLVLTKEGNVWTWGKGDGFRLGHGSEEHSRFPKVVEGLRGKHVVNISLGSVHCLSATSDGKVYAWGRNDKGQLGLPDCQSKASPTEVDIDGGKSFECVVCGPAQSFAWFGEKQRSIGLRTPFAVDVSKITFEYLDALLRRVSEDLDGTQDWPPPAQEKECIAVTALNLLRLQFHAAIQENISGESLGLGVGSKLLQSLRQQVVMLAVSKGVLTTVKDAAKATLTSGWSLLLPTTEERAKTLSELLAEKLESSDNTVGDTGRGFMIDLLIESLMVEGSLERAFESAVKSEIDQEVNDDPPGVLDVSTHPPLLQLARELLRNSANTCLSRFQVNKSKPDDLTTGEKDPKHSPIMKLLLKLQRLLIGSIFTIFVACHQSPTPEKGAPPVSLLKGSFSLLQKYIQLLSLHVSEILVEVHSISTSSPYRLTHVCQVVEQELPTVLLPEFVTSLVLLHTRVGLNCEFSTVFKVLKDLLDLLDKFNRLTPNIKVEDGQDLAWPGEVESSSFFSRENISDLPVIQKSDLENHNKEGQLWVVIHGKVYDLQEFKDQAPCGKELLASYAAKNASEAFEAANHSHEAREMMQAFCVGIYMESEEHTKSDQTPPVVSPLLDTERCLAALLGFHAHLLCQSTPVTTVEEDCDQWLTSDFFAGGLETSNTLKEQEKNDCPSFLE